MNLNQVTIPVSNVVESIPFYEQLGLVLIVHTHDDYARFECPDGFTTLSLHTATNFSAKDRTTLYFECADVDEEIRKLQKKGITIESMPQDQSWLWREAQLRDPDGHPIIIYHAGEHRRFPPWRKSTESL